MRYYTNLHSKKVNERRQTLITKFIRTPAAATPPPPPPPTPGLPPSAEDNDDVDFLGFEDVLKEAENFMRNEGDSDSDVGDSGNEMATGSTY